MPNNSFLRPDELKLWKNLYNTMFTIDGKECLITNDGRKELVLLPMLTFTILSTMLQKLKYLPNSCFNRIVIGQTPICILRSSNETTNSTIMSKLTKMFHVIIDGIRKQHINSITMIFYKKTDPNTIYNSYSIVFDYKIKLNENETSINLIADIIHQIEYLFNWNDILPNDVELTFVLSVLDQFENEENKIPKPFYFVKQNIEKVYKENETNHLMGRLTTLHGKIWLKFLPNTQQLSGSSFNSQDLIIQTNIEKDKQLKSSNINKLKSVISSPKLKRSNISIDSNKIQKKKGFLSTIKSLITPSRISSPMKSSTPNVVDLILIDPRNTPNQGETGSRITLGDNVSTNEISTTPMINVERRSTIRGQAAIARKKIAAMQIRDDNDDDYEKEEEEDEEDEFKKLFSQKRTKKSKDSKIVSTKKIDNFSDISSISSCNSNVESLLTPPITRKRVPNDRSDVDDLIIEHGTPPKTPKTPRTIRRNRIDDEISMNTNNILVNVDSPRLLRSLTKKLQQQSSIEKQFSNEEKTNQSETQNTNEDEEEMNRVYVQLERSSIALHYSMDESD